MAIRNAAPLVLPAALIALFWRRAVTEAKMVGALARGIAQRLRALRAANEGNSRAAHIQSLLTRSLLGADGESCKRLLGSSA